MDEMEFIVENGEALGRIDLYIAKKTALSRSQVKKLIDEGNALLNGNPTKPKNAVKTGDRIILKIPPPKTLDLSPQEIPVEILFQDEHLAVINKPRGMVVHPGSGVFEGTLVNALLFHFDDLSGIGGEKRPGIVHRLDKNTSGLILIAKNDLAHQGLSRQFSSRKIKKEYVALVHGEFKEKRGRIEEPIGRHPVERKKMAVVEGGRDAVTLWEVEEEYKDITLLCLKPLTGRTHQLRVHLKSIGHPIVGDPVYGKKNDPIFSGSQLLHARKIGFNHPATGEFMEFVTPLPQDMEKIIRDMK